jgi:YD repeat-containing protein
MAKGKGRNFQKILVSQTVQGGMSSEEKQEEVKRWNQNNKLLAKIEENTRGVGGGGDPRVEPDSGGSALSQIGIISAMVAASLGTLVGAIQGHIAAIKWFGSKMIPSSVINKLSASMDATRKFFTDGVSKVRNFVKGIMDGFTKMFKSDGLGKVSQMLTRGVAAIKDFFKPITEAMKYVRTGGGFIANLMKTVRSGISSVMGFFGRIGNFFGSFSKVFAGFAAVAKKIFLPLTIVMTIWDTVKGMFAGFEENGIVGGITGAIEGFVNSLIMAPLDMLKGAVSWVLDAFGFENASAALDSFSFEELYSGFIDGITSAILAIPEYLGKAVDWISESFMAGVNTISDAFNEYIIEPISNMFDSIKNFFSDMADQIIGFVTNLGIPAITFSIPLYGDVTLGPWYPFRDESQAEQAVANNGLGLASRTSTEDLGDGSTRINREDGSYDISGAEGTHRYDADGNLVSHTSPSMNGFRQTTFADGSTLDQLDNGGLSKSVARDASGATVADRTRYAMGDIIVEGVNQRGDTYGSITGLETGETRQFSGDVNDQDMLRMIAGVQPAPVGQMIEQQSIDNQIARTAAPAGGGNTTIVNAPVSNSSSTTAAYRPNIRNQRPQERAWYDIF